MRCQVAKDKEQEMQEWKATKLPLEDTLHHESSTAAEQRVAWSDKTMSSMKNEVDMVLELRTELDRVEGRREEEKLAWQADTLAVMPSTLQRGRELGASSTPRTLVASMRARRGSRLVRLGARARGECRCRAADMADGDACARGQARATRCQSRARYGEERASEGRAECRGARARGVAVEERCGVAREGGSPGGVATSPLTLRHRTPWAPSNDSRSRAVCLDVDQKEPGLLILLEHPISNAASNNVCTVDEMRQITQVSAVSLSTISNGLYYTRLPGA